MKSKFDEKFDQGLRASLGEYFPIQLDITNVCNLKCAHCYHPHHQNLGALDFNGWRVVIDQYLSFIEKYNYRPLFILCGGEPTLSPHLVPILEYLQKKFSSAQKAIKILLISNGTMPERIPFALLKNFETTIQISLDGHSEATHDSVRGLGSFAKTVNAISIIQKEGVPLTALAILSSRTAAFIPRIFDLCLQLGIGNLGFTRLVDVGFAGSLISSGVDRTLLGKELRGALMQIVIESARTGIRTNTNSPLFSILAPNLGASGEYWKSIVISYQGKMLLSSRSRFEIGDAIIDGIEKVVTTNEILLQIKNGNIDQCRDCAHLKKCGGDRNAAYARFGSFLARDPGCWIEEKNKVRHILKSAASGKKGGYMVKLKVLATSVLALLPFSRMAIAQEQINDSDSQGRSSESISAITEEDIFHMRVLFNQNESVVEREAAIRRFKAVFSEVEDTEFSMKFQNALATLISKGLIDDKGVTLHGGHSGWRAE